MKINDSAQANYPRAKVNVLTGGDRMQYQLDAAGAQRWLDALRKNYTVYAPMVFSGEGRYAYTDDYRYGEVENFSDILYTQRTRTSMKEVLLPINHTVGVEINGELVSAVQAPEKPLLVFLRACDRHALARLDDSFAQDAYYQSRRKGMQFVIMECVQGWDTCFCVATGTNTAEEYDAAVRFLPQGGAVVFIEQEALGHGLTLSKAAPQAEPLRFAEKNEMQVRIPAQPEKARPAVKQLAALPLWEEYAKRCIGCGACNMACPTCTCVQTRKIPVSAQVNEVRRVWGGCQVVMSEVLKSTGKTMSELVPRRVMQRVLDKFYRPAASKEQPCVGCGRCIDICPRLINFGTTVSRFSDALDTLDTQAPACSGNEEE